MICQLVGLVVPVVDTFNSRLTQIAAYNYLIAFPFNKL